MVIHPTEARVVAVLDWEIATVGDPLADFTYLLSNWINGAIPPQALANGGLPSQDDFVAEYCRLTGRPGLAHLDWYFAYNLFRSAAICQGIVGRIRDGTANSPTAAENEARVPVLAAMGWDYARRAGAA
jgi:aminoglycoside phosphotransferase (APT) family kinase protein